MTVQHDLAPLHRIGILAAGVALALLADPDAARALQDGSRSTATVSSTTSPAPDESLTVLGRRHHFEAAPVPGAPLGPPPDKPGPHLGRYKISGDQTQRDGFDAQTGAFIAPFGTAYTGASPTADGLASRFGH